MRALRLHALALCCALTLIGCSSERGNGSADASRSKADDLLSAAECAALDAKTDKDGVCRAGDGRFAPAQCCADSEVCKEAVLEDDGTCRRADNGKFAPASCCAAKCDGAGLDEHGFCRADSGQFAPAACCADQCFVAQPPAGSCKGACGESSTEGACFCDDSCSGNGDCCADKVAECGGNGNLPDGLAIPKGTCSKTACGEQSKNGDCFCDDACTEFGDCCKNKPTICGGEGLDVELADCGPDECEGVEIVDGVCRKPNGQFAKATCCAELPVCASARTDAKGVCRRADDGQFAPSLCCADLCQGSRFDHDGSCRQADGKFAQPGCCADACFELAERPTRTRTVKNSPACNGDQK